MGLTIMSIKTKASDVSKINFGIIILINLLDIIHYCIIYEFLLSFNNEVNFKTIKTIFKTDY